MIHDAPGAIAAGGGEVCGVHGWCGVVLFGDGCLKDGFPAGEFGVGGEAEHDFGGQPAVNRGGEVERPHFGPEPSAQTDRWRTELQVGEVELSTEMIEDGVEFGGMVDVRGFRGDTHIYDRNGNYRQCLLIC